uniref:DUF4371 domain-containing protein n=1 Tax=Latimeria chalumnae TaxID=7897 RepID=H3A1E8_LATCH
WLHYDQERDVVLCFFCMRAYSVCYNGCQANKGYSNWKDAAVNFARHEASRCHRDAVAKTVSLPAATAGNGESHSTQPPEEKLERQKCFMKLLSSVQYLARQNLPLGGDGQNHDSNLSQLLKLRGEDDLDFLGWLKGKAGKYTSPEIQNEVLKEMAFQVLQDIGKRVHKAPFFSVMVEEMEGTPSSEEFVIGLRWVDDRFHVYEEFIELFKVACVDAETLVYAIKGVLQRLNLSLSKARGQCYEAAAGPMAALKFKVAKQVMEEEPKAIHLHCYAQTLGLACGDYIKRCALMKDVLDTTYEIGNLVKRFPRGTGSFMDLKEQLSADTLGVRILCPARWTVGANALLGIASNYEVLQEAWPEMLAFATDPELKSRIRGVSSHMAAFDFLFGVMLGELVLRHSDDLSRALQQEGLRAAEGEELVSAAVQTLASLRTEANFKTFWNQVTKTAEPLNIGEPQVSRPRKKARKCDEGRAPPKVPAATEDHYRLIYYEAVALVISCVRNRFDQKAASGMNYEAEFAFITCFYGTDFEPQRLKTQLEILSTQFTGAAKVPKGGSTISLLDIVGFLRSFTLPQRQVLSEVCTLVNLILSLPAANAVCERSLCTSQRLRNYLRATRSQDRQGHLMLLHVHEHLTDNLDLKEIANTLVSASDGCLTFTES